jgi:hypothetical protein
MRIFKDFKNQQNLDFSSQSFIFHCVNLVATKNNFEDFSRRFFEILHLQRFLQATPLYDVGLL